MKSIVRKSLIVGLFLLVSSTGKAQVSLGFTGSFNLPVGALGDMYRSGVGGTTTIKLMISEDMAIGANLGYHYYAVQGAFQTFSNSFMPITALLEYYFSDDDIRPYAGIDIGAYNYRVAQRFGGQTFSDSRILFGFAPNVGALIALSDGLDLNLNVKYNYIFHTPPLSNTPRPFAYFGLGAGLFINFGD
ncbi:MAG: hypothetical protein ACK4ND_02590 [Cytophagaceae bacterium]